MGARDFQSMSGAEEMERIEPLMVPVWKRRVAVIRKRDWMAKEVARVPRRRGRRRRHRREKKKAPSVKLVTDVRDLAQP